MMTFLDFIVAEITNGLIIGCVYALMAIGVTFIFAIMKMVNFAHGEFYMMGGYIAYYVAQLMVPPQAILLVAFVCVFGAGIIVERMLLRTAYTQRIERRDEYAIIVTFALSLTLQNLALAVFGPYSKAAPEFGLIPGIVLSLPGVPSYRPVASILAIVIVVAVLIFVKKTMIGRALEATAQDRDGAVAVGIDADRMGQLAFGLGTGLAAVAGCILAPVFLVYPDMGYSVAVKAFVIVVLGGLGSVKGSIIGAILLGLIESLGVAFISPAYRDVYAFIVLIVVLALRPRGLFGEKVRAV